MVRILKEKKYSIKTVQLGVMKVNGNEVYAKKKGQNPNA